ncbi:hypothetical protein ACWGS9_28915 [Bradyrhizobium sp. Arg314]
MKIPLLCSYQPEPMNQLKTLKIMTFAPSREHRMEALLESLIRGYGHVIAVLQPAMQLRRALFTVGRLLAVSLSKGGEFGGSG